MGVDLGEKGSGNDGLWFCMVLGALEDHSLLLCDFCARVPRLLYPLSLVSPSRPFLLSGMFLTSNCGGAASLLLVVLFGVGLVLLYGAGSACITEKERAFTDGTGIPSTHLAMIPPFAC